jgi:hypothetical protein
MHLARELVGIGVLATIGISIVMTIIISTNTTGWQAGVTNMGTVIIPLVLAAGFVLTVIGISLQRKHDGL